MSYVESRAHWRKLWRKEPPGRIELSCMARGVTLMLIREAADDGCVGPVDDRYHRASHLARRLGIRPQDRRAFNRTIDELLAYDGDRESLRLVLRDGHFYLTGFEQVQARCKPGVSPGVSEVYDQVPQESPNPPELHNTKTAKPTEERRKKKDVRT